MRRRKPPAPWETIAQRVHHPIASCRRKFTNMFDGVDGYHPPPPDPPVSLQIAARRDDLIAARKRLTPVDALMGSPPPGWSEYDSPNIESETLFAWCLDCGQSSRLCDGHHVMRGKAICLREVEAVYAVYHCPYCEAPPARIIPAPRAIPPVETDDGPIKYTALVLRVRKKAAGL